VPFREVVERFWERRPEFHGAEPRRLPPVLIEEPIGGATIAVADSRAILDHLEETLPEEPLPAQGARRARGGPPAPGLVRPQVRLRGERLLLHEKLEKRIMAGGSPDMKAIRSGWEALRGHFDYWSSCWTSATGWRATACPWPTSPPPRM
jgi:glutathione S-transferase